MSLTELRARSKLHFLGQWCMWIRKLIFHSTSNTTLTINYFSLYEINKISLLCLYPQYLSINYLVKLKDKSAVKVYMGGIRPNRDEPDICSLTSKAAILMAFLTPGNHLLQRNEEHIWEQKPQNISKPKKQRKRLLWIYLALLQQPQMLQNFHPWHSHHIQHDHLLSNLNLFQR